MPEHFPGKTDSLRSPLVLWRRFNRMCEKPCDVTGNPVGRLRIREVGEVWLQDRGNKRLERELKTARD